MAERERAAERARDAVGEHPEQRVLARGGRALGDRRCTRSRRRSPAVTAQPSAFQRTAPVGMRVISSMSTCAAFAQRLAHAGDVAGADHGDQLLALAPRGSSAPGSRRARRSARA